MTLELEDAYRQHLTSGDRALLAEVATEGSLLRTLASPELELLGARWYRRALRLSPAPSGSVGVLDVIADGFTDARRVLNVVTDTYLFPLREQWFGRPAA